MDNRYTLEIPAKNTTIILRLHLLYNKFIRNNYNTELFVNISIKLKTQVLMSLWQLTVANSVSLTQTLLMTSKKNYHASA